MSYKTSSKLLILIFLFNTTNIFFYMKFYRRDLYDNDSQFNGDFYYTDMR